MRAIMNMPRDVVMEELLPWKRETGEAFTRGNGFYNPYWLLNEISNGDGRNNFRGNLTLNIKPIQGMNIRLRASVEKANKNGWKFDNYYTMWDIDGQYETFREASNNYNYEGVISYNRNIKKVSLSANLGTSMQKNDWYKLWNQVSQLAGSGCEVIVQQCLYIEWDGKCECERETVRIRYVVFGVSWFVCRRNFP